MRERRLCRGCGAPFKPDETEPDTCQTCHTLSPEAIARILESYRPLDDEQPDPDEEEP